MTFENMNTADPGMPMVMDAPVDNSLMQLAIRMALANTAGPKTQYRGLKRITFLQRREENRVAIKIEGAEFATLVMSEKEDLPHPIDNIMVSNAPNNKTINTGEGKGSLIDSHGVQVVVGLDRIGISARYQTSGRGWRRWANQFNNRQGSNLESLDYNQEKVRLIENNNRDLFMYAHSNTEITRVPRNTSALAKLAFQVKCAYGTLAKLVNKAGRKAPHGTLHITANISEGELRLGMKGIGMKGDQTLEATTIEGKAREGHSVSPSFNGSVSASIHYKEWFRFAREKSQNGYSIEKALSLLRGRYRGENAPEVSEVFGITEEGNFVYGVQVRFGDRTDTVLVTFPKTDISVPLADSELSLYTGSTPAPARRRRRVEAPPEVPPTPVATEVVEEPTVNRARLELSTEEQVMLDRWATAHRMHCNARNMSVSQDRLVWFRHYMTQCLANGDRVGETHLALYSKLRDHES